MPCGLFSSETGIWSFLCDGRLHVPPFSSHGVALISVFVLRSRLYAFCKLDHLFSLIIQLFTYPLKKFV